MNSPDKLEVLSQGAEAIIYILEDHPYLFKPNKDKSIKTKVIVKERPKKKYRHKILDDRLTKQRTTAEARILAKLAKENINVPGLIAVDPIIGSITMSYIEGPSLKELIWKVEKVCATCNKNISSTDDNENLNLMDIDTTDNNDDKNFNTKINITKLQNVLSLVGQQIAKLHLLDIVHGDLTTSNIVMGETISENDILYATEINLTPFLIDFGLSSHSTLAEDKAVDLYVLERAFLSTHPQFSSIYLQILLNGYSNTFKNFKNGGIGKLNEILNRLEKVRMRGRKRSMVG